MPRRIGSVHRVQVLGDGRLEPAPRRQRARQQAHDDQHEPDLELERTQRCGDQHPEALDRAFRAPRPLQALYRNGLRWAPFYGALARASAWAVDRPLRTPSPAHRRVTALGKAVVRELVDLNVILDVSHCSEKTTMDILAMTDVPILCNHANAKALTVAVRGPMLLGRNKSDAELRAIAERGGVIGVTTVAWMLDRDGDTLHLQLTYEDETLFKVPFIIDHRFEKVENEEILPYNCEGADYDWFDKLNAPKDGESQ